MSVRPLREAAASKKVVGRGRPAPYVRNKHWLTLPTVSPTDERVVGIYAINKDANFVALSVAGNYTVDWGDGVTENFATGVVAQHQYSFSDTDLTGSDAPVTLSASNIVSRTGHGYIDGEPIRFYNIVTSTGLTHGAAYFVKYIDANSFRVSATLGGADVSFSTGTASLLEYKQAIVSITPQGGDNITSVILNKRHTSLASSPVNIGTGWLDIVVSSPSLSTLHVGTTTPTQEVTQSLLESFSLISTNTVTVWTNCFISCRHLVNVSLKISSSATSLQQLFNNCVALERVSLEGTTGVTNFSSMFNSCFSLREAPLFNTAAGTDFSYMFNHCHSLQDVPLFNTAAGTNFSNMFYYCASLQDVPLLNTALGTNFSSMFNSCQSLPTIPLLNTASGTDFSNMFANCYSLQDVPLLNTASGTDFSYMFYYCYSLQDVPLFNTAAGTNFSNMFYYCASLQDVPLLNTALGTNFNSMFSYCYTLSTIPLLNTAAGTNFNSMFNSCQSLVSVPALNVAAATDLSYMYSGCVSLSSIGALGVKISMAVASCKLSSTELDAIYTNLYGPVTAKTITVTGNYGTSGDTPSIATAKGWTVTG